MSCHVEEFVSRCRLARAAPDAPERIAEIVCEAVADLFDMPGRLIWRDGETRSTPFSVRASYRFGMELTLRRRRELGIDDESGPKLPSLSSDR